MNIWTKSLTDAESVAVAVANFTDISDLRNYWTDSKNSSGIWKPWENCRGKTNFIELGVTSDVTGQVKVKMFDISGLVTSASKIAMLSTNKAN